MKNKLIAMILLGLFISCKENDSNEKQFIYEGNPIVRYMFTADPSARVFNGRLYVYTSHDEDTADANQHFLMNNWHVFSTEDMINWTGHGQILSLDDISWTDRQAWAPDCIERNGKYYFYFPVEQTKIGVAVSNSPVGPFKDILGRPLIDNTNNEVIVGREPIDPALFIDDDGQAYMYFGCRDARVVKLKENMIEIEGEIQPIVIKGNKEDAENSGGYYAEAPWMFKRDSTYYFVYSNGWRSQSTIIYAIGNNPMGPFNYVGEVMSPVGAGTSHASILQYNDKWYIFYHNNVLSDNGKRRSICYDEITFDIDGKINHLIYNER
ncbi:MAG: family 43 glycosylhydrolase [Ignavibacteriae bacterium]|nr:family 43 glycosylhydrolase [Ignavibacteriota bacterium]MCB9210793.1 family 43 glycosylhydrolase [Ignavibacteriales bacterium]MCB9260062.1 family 43 glycosylhydrolase [Ignavibacteriales bacterium]